jgi:cytochrome c biogenesis protein CcdA
MQTLILGSSILAAFLGGVLALFAPCCIVSLLPTYMAAMLRVTRWRLVHLTGVFALGVALVLLPVVLGVGALGQLFNQAHREVFFLGGVLMLGMAVSTLLGKGWSLPMPMLRRPDVSGQAGATFLLGIFSGIVSSCCAPVLSGVLVLSATATSTLHVLAIGLAYVLGMVTPLFFAALLWDRLGLAERDIFRSRRVSVPLGDSSFSVRLTDLGAFVIFFAMGSLMVGLALTGRGTYTPQFLVRLNHWGSDRFAVLTQKLSIVPEWAVGAGLLLVIVGLATLAWPRGRTAHAGGDAAGGTQPQSLATLEAEASTLPPACCRPASDVAVAAESTAGTRLRHQKV